LRFAHDARSIHGQKDVVFLEASLARRGILVDHGHLNSLLFFQLQSAKPVGGNIHDVHTQIGARPRIFAGNTQRLRGIKRPFLRGVRQVEQQRQQDDSCQNLFAHDQPPES
jgi:hypothetical protein